MLDKMNWHHEIEHDNKGWWFWNEDWSRRIGPYPSQELAEHFLERYADSLESEVRRDDS